MVIEASDPVHKLQQGTLDWPPYSTKILHLVTMALNHSSMKSGEPMVAGETQPTMKEKLVKDALTSPIQSSQPCKCELCELLSTNSDNPQYKKLLRTALDCRQLLMENSHGQKFWGKLFDLYFRGTRPHESFWSTSL